jgi:GNAT superfamily N-acetyltransferase
MRHHATVAGEAAGRGAARRTTLGIDASWHHPTHAMIPRPPSGSIIRIEEVTMKVKCFACDVVIEAPDLTVLADAFVAHGHEVHTWTYPERAVRNYACNYAEAAERLSGEVARRDTIGEVTIRPVTPANLTDWSSFFDHDGFAGNPDWASCYCLEHHVPTTPEEPERAWRDARSMMLERLGRGTTFGYLAYVDGRPAGWVNASLRADYDRYRDIDPTGPEPATVIGVSCFVIAPPYRRHGVASALLDHVIAEAPARGAAWIEAYPLQRPDDTDAGHYRGPRGMYEARGFAPVVQGERDAVMRRPVG